MCVCVLMIDECLLNKRENMQVKKEKRIEEKKRAREREKEKERKKNIAEQEEGERECIRKEVSC